MKRIPHPGGLYKARQNFYTAAAQGSRACFRRKKQFF